VETFLRKGEVVREAEGEDLQVLRLWFFAHDGFTEEAEALMREKGVLWSTRQDLDNLLKSVGLRQLPDLPDAKEGTHPCMVWGHHDIWQLQSGDLPSGLVLITSPSVATIEGTPTTAGTYVFTLELSDSDTPAQTATQEYTLVICAGDFDYDGDVDGSDLAVFAADFGRADCDTDAPCVGDFDADGDVDGIDLAVFAADFGRTDCPY
jgi:putative Ig domain-containing protein